jgi:hypothetical protein
LVGLGAFLNASEREIEEAMLLMTRGRNSAGLPNVEHLEQPPQVLVDLLEDDNHLALIFTK